MIGESTEAAALLTWIDGQVAPLRQQLDRTTDKITVAYLSGRIEAFQAVQVRVTFAAYGINRPPEVPGTGA